MSDKMCSISKDGIKKSDHKKFVALVCDAKFYCKKCGRLSNKKKNLCKGEKLAD